MQPQKSYKEPFFLGYLAIVNIVNNKPANDNKPNSWLEDIADKEAEKNRVSSPSNIVYLDDYRQKRQNFDYESTKGTYLNRRQQALTDFSDRVPGKHVSTFSRNEMPGVLGFTYLGQGRMALRDDLTGKTKKMVDIHESIHAPDEYETRVLTDWIMSKPSNKYIK